MQAVSQVEPSAGKFEPGDTLIRIQGVDVADSAHAVVRCCPLLCVHAQDSWRSELEGSEP